MDRKRLLQWYHNYALLLGVTSYRLVAGRFRQTWLTRRYALFMNTFEILTLPLVFWMAARYLELVSWWPNFITSTSYILNAVIYVTIVYTVLSRGRRDSVLVDVERIVAKVERHGFDQRKYIGRSLSYIFYLKYGAVLYQCLSGWVMTLMLPHETRWKALIGSFLYGNAMNIPVIATQRYFQALWSLTCCYQYINIQLMEIIRSAHARKPTSVHLAELHRLWALHALLGRCTLCLNRIYGLMMIAARFYNFISSAFNWYWGMLFYFGIDAPLYLLVYGTFNFWIRLIDFFLLDDMCDLAIKYQSSPHDALNVYLLYASTSRISFSACGLYNANRKFWFQMLGAIVGYSILLLQFHLVMRDSYKL
ncbi:uncharacterized protein Dvir_GJ21369 [Drosophila virilis]|uniref:Gustatory receptor n=1 Tax=Drosophila virilis TaxID=7244 RepID=B4LPB8_DROVI|nr:uncharacterized protein Dvir_GJ21369 [Drosophila virilis]